MACPACGQSLARQGGAARCAAAHSFDFAREGYLNLKLRGTAAGDSRDMLAARDRFLRAGHYAPLMQALSAAACTVLEIQDEPALVDAGSGGGHYLEAVLRAVDPYAAAPVGPRPLSDAWPVPRHDGPLVVGLDASQDAAKQAGRRLPEALFVVADLWQPLPIQPSAIDLILNVFAPRNPAEFARILRPSGLLLVVIPGEAHLTELRAQLPMLGLQPDKEAHIEASLGAHFQLIGRAPVDGSLRLSHKSVEDLLNMSPTSRHSDRLDWQATLIELSEPLVVTASFVLLTFQRR